MADLDPEQHQVVFRIAVIGGVGQRFLELINAKDGELELPAVHLPGVSGRSLGG
jgi:hypothetical protein